MNGGGRERKDAGKSEGKKEKTKEQKKIVSKTLSFQDLGFHQLTLGLVIELTFEIEHN